MLDSLVATVGTTIVDGVNEEDMEGLLASEEAEELLSSEASAEEVKW